MKIKHTTIFAAAVLAGTIFISSCNKEDLVAPVIALKGNGEVTLNLGETYTEAGVTATDDEDGDISSKVVTTGTVNTDEVGTTTITYSIADAAGNTAEVTRTVKVKSDNLAGTYSVSDVVTNCTPSTNNGTYSYNVTVTQSSTDYNKILISNFGGLSTSGIVYATVSGTTFTIPSQAVTGANPTTNVSGSGTFIKSAGIFKIDVVNYTASNVYFGQGVATYTKQ